MKEENLSIKERRTIILKCPDNTSNIDMQEMLKDGWAEAMKRILP